MENILQVCLQMRCSFICGKLMHTFIYLFILYLTSPATVLLSVCILKIAEAGRQLGTAVGAPMTNSATANSTVAEVFFFYAWCIMSHLHQFTSLMQFPSDSQSVSQLLWSLSSHVSLDVPHSLNKYITVQAYLSSSACRTICSCHESGQKSKTVSKQD